MNVHQKSARAWLSLLLCSSLFTACVGGKGSSGDEGGAEAGTAAGSEAGVTAGDEGGAEAGAVAGNEGGAAAGVTAGSEGGAEAGLMAGVSAGTEAGVQAGAEAGGMAGATGGATGGAMGGAEAGMSSPWFIGAHPCVGSKTDALHCDDDQTCYVGCGTNAEGRGLFVTRDAGVSWGAVRAEPATFLQDSRVNDISRSADGNLYIAGDLPNRAGVVFLDEGAALREVFTRGDMTDFAFTPGSFRRSESGRAIAESLTGNGIVYRESDARDPVSSWSSAYGFWNDGDDDDVATGVQLLSMELNGEDFYAVGSTINSPNTVFLPNWGERAGFDFTIVQLNARGLGAFNGELWDLDVSERIVMLGGVDQDAGDGVIYWGAPGPELADPASWRFLRVSSLIPDQATWVSGVCVDPTGQKLVAVGRESREGWGFILYSSDGGANFTDISPRDRTSPDPIVPDVSRCVIKGDTLMIAGADGLFATYSLASTP